MTITVRVAGERDVPALLALLQELHPDDPPPTPGRVQDVWRQIAAQAGRTILLAETGGAVVGTLDALVIANLTRAGRPHMLVENVVVSAAARRRGVGGRLIAAAVDLARTAGCYKVQLLSRSERGNAHAFYEAHGFAPVAQGYRAYLG